MPILDPLRSPIYESGGLIQQCDHCRWAQRGHKVELIDCPQCGQRLGKQLALGFGGMGVVYLGKNFEIFQRIGGWVSLEENDLPEIVQFLCKHGFDRRTGHIARDAGSPRRIPYRHLSEQLFAGD
jgi:hypothetical protein